MSTTFILALIGAGAWIPQAISYLAKILSTPIINIIPNKFVEVGFSSFGPILNLNLSVSVKNKDTIIDFIGVTVSHIDSGATYHYEWVGMTEIFSEIVQPLNSVNQKVKREYSPTAVKLNILSLLDRTFRFQHAKFIENNKIIIEKLRQHVRHAKLNQVSFDTVINDKEINNFYKFIEENMDWKSGEYRISFLIRSPDKIKEVSKEYLFSLSQDDIRLFQENITFVKNYTEKSIQCELNSPQKILEEPWNWVYKTLIEVPPKKAKRKWLSFSQ